MLSCCASHLYESGEENCIRQNDSAAVLLPRATGEVANNDSIEGNICSRLIQSSLVAAMLQLRSS